MWTGICLGICGAIVIAWVLTRSYEKEFVEQLNEKEHSFRMLYQLSLFAFCGSEFAVVVGGVTGFSPLEGGVKALLFSCEVDFASFCSAKTWAVCEAYEGRLSPPCKIESLH